jgi:hypothetical protein
MYITFNIACATTYLWLTKVPKGKREPAGYLSKQEKTAKERKLLRKLEHYWIERIWRYSTEHKGARQAVKQTPCH